MNLRYTKKKTVMKTFNKDGHWIVRPGGTQVSLCACGNKYIRTRDAQHQCIKCLYIVKK